MHQCQSPMTGLCCAPSRCPFHLAMSLMWIFAGTIYVTIPLVTMVWIFAGIGPCVIAIVDWAPNEECCTVGCTSFGWHTPSGQGASRRVWCGQGYMQKGVFECGVWSCLTIWDANNFTPDLERCVCVLILNCHGLPCLLNTIWHFQLYRVWVLAPICTLHDV